MKPGPMEEEGTASLAQEEGPDEAVLGTSGLKRVTKEEERAQVDQAMPHQQQEKEVGGQLGAAGVGDGGGVQDGQKRRNGGKECRQVMRVEVHAAIINAGKLPSARIWSQEHYNTHNFENQP